MNNAKRKLFSTFTALMLCAVAFTGFFSGYRRVATADSSPMLFCDDGDTFAGEGTKTDATYDIYCDDDKNIENVSHYTAPSFGNGDDARRNSCGPLAGLNVVGFYDRWYINLIPDYEPGMMTVNGYKYYPDLDFPETLNSFQSMYSYMKTGELGGTTSANFKSGLNAYVNNAGYSLSMTSMYSNSRTVDLNKLKVAVQQNKVGLVMLSSFNYISAIVKPANGGSYHVVKFNYQSGHMMMVYGYFTQAFYKEGVAVETNTYLYVSTGFSSGEQGYIQLNDYLTIEEAYIMNIS